MDRRDLLASAGATLLSSLSCRTASASPAQTVFRLGTTSSPTSQFGAGAAAFIKQVGDTTEGRVRVEFYPSSQLGGEREMAEDIISGGLDMAFLSTNVLAAFSPIFGLFDIPFIFKNAQQARGFLNSEGGQRILGKLSEAGLIGLGWGENGIRHVTTFDRPVRSPADLKGLKIRVPQSEIMVRAFQAFGADAKPLPFPELYGALASGTFDAQENPIGVILAARLFECQHVLNLTGHIYTPAVFLVSTAAMTRLSSGDRAAVRAAAVQAGQVSRETADKIVAAGIGELHRQGMTVVEDVDHAAFVAAMAGLEGDLVRQFGRDQIDAARFFAS